MTKRTQSLDLTNLPEWSHLIVHSMADGVNTVDGEMHITDLNQAAENLPASPGRRLWDIFAVRCSKAASADGSVA
jgi:hypothetical protein